MCFQRSTVHLDLELAEHDCGQSCRNHVFGRRSPGFLDAKNVCFLKLAVCSLDFYPPSPSLTLLHPGRVEGPCIQQVLVNIRSDRDDYVGGRIVHFLQRRYHAGFLSDNDRSPSSMVWKCVYRERIHFGGSTLST